MIEQQLLPLLGDTKIVRVQDFSSFFHAEFPAGSRVALFFTEGERSAARTHLFSALSPFSPRCAAVGENCASGLFSLPDEVRAVVALGNRAVLAARFFATLRGVGCLAVPTSPSAEECFAPGAPPPFSGYPLRAPDKILLCGNFLHADCAAALAHTALAAVCAEELRADALFGERKPVQALEAAAGCAASLSLSDGEDRETLFYASALFALSRKVPFACMGMADYLRTRLPQKGSKAALSALKTCAERTFTLFERAKPRPFFVPDYAARLRLCAERTGIPYASLRKNVRIPSGEESFERVHIFEQSRRRMADSARFLCDYVRKIACRCDAEGVSPAAAEDAYSLSAELTPLLCAPVLEREFGLLCVPAHTNAEKIKHPV